eukprot:CAMPEP_0198112510 /NCGR_PEP_ID=MMETSP1442-20131203/4359_1 /TAXON_ID= /ORGANISM="Craspedostauros australis, Strain CCMP3328" /LENGTH=200 /DNA_ID=CAMNT_0043769313 /DNA_START=236 /DNA_END=834 /DNA_ORIENTATION=+
MRLSVSSAIVATLMGMFSAANADNLLLQDFTNCCSGWEVTSDEVIPEGSSQGTLIQDANRSYFEGLLFFQPFMDGPGFVKIVGTKSFPNIAGCGGIEITMESDHGYDGYYIAIGSHPPSLGNPFPYGWLAPIPISGPGKNVYNIPFAEFSNYWDYATGKIITPCSADPSLCVTSDVLSNIQFMEIWVRGIEKHVVTELFT